MNPSTAGATVGAATGVLPQPQLLLLLLLLLPEWEEKEDHRT